MVNDGVSTLTLASAMARHAAQSHAVTAQNVARADVPGATALRVKEFRETLGPDALGSERLLEDTGQAINIEREMLSMAEASGMHGASMAIWKSTLNMLRLAASGPQS